MLEDKRKKIEVINRGRATGRTTELIRRCAKYNYALIVTPSKNRARSVFEQARSQGIYIPFPITFKEFCRGEFCGRNVDAFFFDDLDASLKEMAMWAPIEAVVIEGDETNTGDLISRQAVKNWIQRWNGYIDEDIIARMQYRVIDIPSAKPEIIRCRDGKYLGTVYTKRQGETWCFCSEIGTGTELNGWCWYGERREEDDRPD